MYRGKTPAIRSDIAVARLTGWAHSAAASAAFSAQRPRSGHGEDFCSTRSHYRTRYNKGTTSIHNYSQPIAGNRVNRAAGRRVSCCALAWGAARGEGMKRDVCPESHSYYWIWRMKAATVSSVTGESPHQCSFLGSQGWEKLYFVVYSSDVKNRCEIYVQNVFHVKNIAARRGFSNMDFTF